MPLSPCSAGPPESYFLGIVWRLLGVFLSRFCKCANLVAGMRTFRPVFRDERLLLVIVGPLTGRGQGLARPTAPVDPSIIFDRREIVSVSARATGQIPREWS